MGKLQDLNNAVATRAETGIQAGTDTLKAVKSQLAESWKMIQSMVPQHVTPERLTRIGINTIRTNPALLKCNVPSLVGAILQCVRFGFEPNSTGEAYIIPYQNEAQFQLGYLGHVQLLHRSGMIAGVGATTVCENDEYNFSYSPRSVPFVNKADGDRGKVRYYFAWVELKTGGYIWEYMSVDEVEKHRRKFSKMPNGKAWRDNFDSMAIKTVLLRVMKLAPKSVEINDALYVDEKVTRGADIESPEDDGLHESDAVDAESEVVDEVTGEVTNNTEQLKMEG